MDLCNTETVAHDNKQSTSDTIVQPEHGQTPKSTAFDNSIELKIFIDQLHDDKSREHLNIKGEEILLRQVLVDTFAQKPSVINDIVYESIFNFYIKSDLNASEGYLSADCMSKLDTSKQPTLTWIKYEKLLCKMIRLKILTPKIVEQEVMITVKQNLPNSTLQRMSSLLASCAKQSRQTLKPRDDDDEKLCDVLDWLAWFCGSSDDV